jgi:uncharacterized protein (DUF2336 family)
VARQTNLIQDVENTIAQRSTPARERTLSKITDLLVHDAERLGDEQLALFDHVLGCFTPKVPPAARADLAGRLSELAKAPPNVTRALAFDHDIVVAQPILSRSGQLSDQDLIEIAITRGGAHMTAICERRQVSELVTDVLVAKGDPRVWRAIAANAGAQFSEFGKAELLQRSSQDETLQDLLGARADLTDKDTRQLVAAARHSAKARISRSLPPEKKAAPAKQPQAPVGLDYASAQQTLRQMAEKRPISEADLASFAAKHLAAEAIAAIAALAVLPVPMIERIFRERNDSSLLIIGKANNWSWRTVRALLGLSHPLLPPPNGRAAEPAFNAISGAEARRTLQGLGAAAAGTARPARTRIKPDGR